MQYFQFIQPLLAEYIPHKVFMAGNEKNDQLPLIANKPATGDTLIYLCREYSCLKPVKQVVELIELISGGNKN